MVEIYDKVLKYNQVHFINHMKYLTADFWYYYKRYCNENKLNKITDNSIFNKTISEAITEIKNELMTGREFNMPFKLGRIIFYKKKVKFVKNYSLYKLDVYKKEGKLIYDFFDETDNYYPKMTWHPHKRLKNKQYYMFKPGIELKKQVWNYFKIHYKDFFVENTKYK